MTWENRIVSQGVASPSDFKFHEANFKIPNDPQKQALSGILGDVGWVQSVIVNQTTGRVIDGHLRVQMAIDRGEKEVPVSYVVLDDEEEKLVLLTLDPIRAMSLMDSKKHAELAEMVETNNEALAGILDKMTDRRVAATSFLDNLIKKGPSQKVWCGETEYDRGENPRLPLTFLLSFNDREEVFNTLNVVKEKEGLPDMNEAYLHILLQIATKGD